VLGARANLHLYWHALREDNYMNGPIALPWVSSAIDLLGWLRTLCETLHDLLSYPVLVWKPTLNHNSETSEILDALQPGAAVTSQLLQDRSGVLEAPRRGVSKITKRVTCDIKRLIVGAQQDGKVVKICLSRRRLFDQASPQTLDLRLREGQGHVPLVALECGP
jgi:hypothetical protein